MLSWRKLALGFFDIATRIGRLGDRDSIGIERFLRA